MNLKTELIQSYISARWTNKENDQIWGEIIDIRENYFAGCLGVDVETLKNELDKIDDIVYHNKYDDEEIEMLLKGLFVKLSNGSVTFG